MAIVETLKVTNRVDDKVDDKVDKVDDKVDRVDNKVDRVGDKVDEVDNKVMVLIDGGESFSGNLRTLNMDMTVNECSANTELQENLQKWLSPPDPSTNHNIARKAHHKGTVSWFFQGGIFKQWKLSPLLWIHGKCTFLVLVTPHSTDSHICSGLRQKRPVVCHSLLFCPHSLRLLPSSGIIEDIKAQCEAGLAIIAFFYCDFRDEDKQNCRSLVLSIISQLCAQSHLCCDTLFRVYLAHDKATQMPSDETLAKCLAEMVSLPDQDPIYIIVDALDECPKNFGLPTPREEVLDLIDNLVGLHVPNLHVCLMSRPEINIQSALEPLTTLRVSLHNQSGQKEDILEYVSSVAHSDKKMRRWREEDRNLVIETLSERADGM